MTNFDQVKNGQKLKARITMSQINCIRGMLCNMHKNTITLPHCFMYLVNIICVLFCLFPGKASYGQLCNCYMLLYSLIRKWFVNEDTTHVVVTVLLRIVY